MATNYQFQKLILRSSVGDKRGDLEEIDVGPHHAEDDVVQKSRHFVRCR